jgi:benzylsuccinate CoA-transferase BbsF subunit
LTGTDILDASVNERPARGPGSVDSNRSAHPAMAPHGIYPTRHEDEWIAISCRHDDDWRALATVVGEGWARRPDFDDLAGRVEHEDELDALVGGWTARCDRMQIVETLLAAGIPASVVATPEERIDHDEVTAAWGLWPSVVHPEMGQVRVDGLPVHLDRTDWSFGRSAPCLGQDNDYVFGDLLGLSSDELDELRSAEVI